MIYYVNEESGVIGWSGVEVECNDLNKCGMGSGKGEKGRTAVCCDVMLARQLEKSHWSRQCSLR